MAEIPSLVPLHCAFCLKHLPMDGAPTVACVRCSTQDTIFALDFRQRVLDAIEAFDTRPVKRLRTLRLRDVDCRAEVENSDPRRGVDQSRLSRASLRDSQAFFHCLRGTPFAHPDVP